MVRNLYTGICFEANFRLNNRVAEEYLFWFSRALAGRLLINQERAQGTARG